MVLIGHSDWTQVTQASLFLHAWELPDCHQEDVQLALRVVYAPMEDWLDLLAVLDYRTPHVTPW